MGEIAISPVHNVFKKYRQVIYVNPYLMTAPAPVIVENTFIGGVASSLYTPALLASKLLNYPSGTTFSADNITNFSIVGTDIKCKINADYSIQSYAFDTISTMTQFIDIGGYCKKLLRGAFFTNANLRVLYFPEVVKIDANATSFSFTGKAIEVMYFPKCIGWGENNAFESTMFKNDWLGASNFYVHPSLETVNSGAVEGDILYAKNLNTNSSIKYVGNLSIPNQVTNLSVGNVWGTAVQINFSPPNSGANAVDFYEVYVNGVYLSKIVSGDYVSGLNTFTDYTFTVKVVDVFYNKSLDSNSVTQKTSATYTIPTANLLSYYKMQNDVLDSKGTKNGTATAITFEDGSVGRRAIFVKANNSNIIAGNSTAFAINNNSSVAFIYRPSSHVTSNVFEYGSYTSWGSLRQDSGGTLTFLFTPISGSYIQITSSKIVPLNVDTLVVLVRNYTTGTIKLYFDNVLVFNYSTSETVAKQSLGNFLIGRGYAGTIEGKVDEFSIWDTALKQESLSEVKSKLLTGQSLI